MASNKENNKRGEEQKPCLLNMLRGHRARVNCLAFHPSLSNIVSGSEDGIVMLWKFVPGNHEIWPKAYRYQGHQGSVNDVSFVNDGSLIVSCSSDHSVRVWTPIVTGGRTLDFKPHTSSVRSLSCHPNKISELATASDDKIVKIWNITRIEKTSDNKLKPLAHQFVTSFATHKNWVRSVRYSPEGNLICTSSDDQTVRVFDLRSRTCISIFNAAPESPTHADFNPQADHYIGMTTIGKKFQIFDRRNCSLLQSYNDIHNGQTHSFAFHPSGDFAFTVAEDSSTKVLDLIEGRSLWTYFGHKHPVRAVSVSKDGNSIVTAGDGKELLVWQPNLPSYNLNDYEKREVGTKAVNFANDSRSKQVADEIEHNENDSDIETRMEQFGLGETPKSSMRSAPFREEN